MDPVQQAVLHHTLGLPPTTKRKHAACSVCRMRFNSQVSRVFWCRPEQLEHKQYSKEPMTEAFGQGWCCTREQRTRFRRTSERAETRGVYPEGQVCYETCCETPHGWSKCILGSGRALSVIDIRELQQHPICQRQTDGSSDQRANLSPYIRHCRRHNWVFKRASLLRYLSMLSENQGYVSNLMFSL